MASERAKWMVDCNASTVCRTRQLSSNVMKLGAAKAVKTAMMAIVTKISIAVKPPAVLWACQAGGSAYICRLAWRSIIKDMPCCLGFAGFARLLRCTDERYWLRWPGW